LHLLHLLRPASSPRLSLSPSFFSILFFFFNYPPPPDIYTLSLHDALPIYPQVAERHPRNEDQRGAVPRDRESQAHTVRAPGVIRSEEHTSELQSLTTLVCRLLLEKKKNKIQDISIRQ